MRTFFVLLLLGWSLIGSAQAQVTGSMQGDMTLRGAMEAQACANLSRASELCGLHGRDALYRPPRRLLHRAL
jgi:hypothetical protein